MKACAGFSLIEVLLATLLSAILGVILFTAYNQVNRIVRSVDNYVDVYSKEALLQNLLSKDIAGAFIPVQAEKQASAKENGKEKPIDYIFVYEPEAEATRFKSFTFITNNPTTVYGSAKPRIARVRYTLREEKGVQISPPSYTLLRQESDTLDINEFTKTDSPIRSYEVVAGIKKIAFTFTKMVKKEEKVEPEVRLMWQSENKKEQEKNEQQQREIVLPQLVSFAITLWDNEKKREREFFGSVLIVTASDTEEQKPEETKKQLSPSKEQQPQQKAAPEDKQENNRNTTQGAMAPVRQQKKTEIVVVQDRNVKKPIRQRGQTLISQLSTGDKHAA